MSRPDLTRRSLTLSGTIDVDDAFDTDLWDAEEDGWEGLPQLIRLIYLDVMHERLSGRHRLH